ncbi:hypothetical protein HT105_25520, partial [Bacteroides fragilis]|nr:hypothetical protein [Bacteroides fragilis]
MSGIPYGEGLESARNTLDEIQKILDARVLPEPAVPAMSGIPYGEGLESARNTLDEIQKILDARVLPEPA